MRIDLHTHSRVGDGTNTPAILVMKALQAGLDMIALTDHDTFDGVVGAAKTGKRIGVKVLPGTEISCQHDGCAAHLFGYGYGVQNHLPDEKLTRVRVGRTQRPPEICRGLMGLGYPVTIDEVMAIAKGAPSVGRPHIAGILAAKGVAANRQEVLNSFLAPGRPVYIPRYSIDVGRAIDLAHVVRGVVVLAHPWTLMTHGTLSTPFIEQLVREHELDGIETDHRDHDREARLLLFEMGTCLRLFHIGSSDYHETVRPERQLGCYTTRKSAYFEVLFRVQTRGDPARPLRHPGDRTARIGSGLTPETEKSLQRSEEHSRETRVEIVSDSAGFRLLTGDRPTGRLYVGHCSDSPQNWMRLQDADIKTSLIVTDYQVIYDHDDIGELKGNAYNMVADYLAAGTDPERATIFTHSAVTVLNQLMSPFFALVIGAGLRRDSTVGDKLAAFNRPMSGLMLTFPVRQATDILFRKANLIPVDRDQLPHVE